MDNIIPVTTKIDFIKIDVEGAELQVLEGGIDTILKNKPVIVFEHGLGAADFYGTQPKDIYELLVGKCGLTLSLMENYLRPNINNGFTLQEFETQFNKGYNFYFIAYPQSK